MRLLRLPSLLLSLLAELCLLPQAARANEATLWAALRGNGHVALMRHADAPGFADPAGFRLEDCATQRNLSAKGRADAIAVGVRLKAQGVRPARLASSAWCRCLDTARLMELGSVETDSAFSNIVVLREQRDTIIKAGRERLRAWTGPGLLLVVTHGANIQALTGYSPASGEIVVVTPHSDGTLAQIGRLPAPQP